MKNQPATLALVLGSLTLGLGIPLALRFVPPNVLYGYRVFATLSNPALWYAVNARLGFGLVFTGVLTLLTTFLLRRRASRHPWLPLGVLLGGLAASGLWSTWLLVSSQAVVMPGPAPVIPVAMYWRLFLAISFLIIVLDLPLAMKRIKPNVWYGFRVRKTLGNEHVWYQANAYFARIAIAIGIVTMALATLLRFTPISPVTYIALCASCFIGSLILAIFMTLGYMRNLA